MAFLKILHTEASCGWGGQEIRILEEARGMIARGHEVSLLCPPESRLFAEAPRYGVPAFAAPIARKNLKGLIAMRRCLQKYRPDVLNTHSSTDTWLAALACRGLANPPPIVRTRHISAAVSQNPASRWLYRGAVRHVVTTGEALRRQLIEQTGIDPGRVTSVPTGIDTTRFSPVDRETRAEIRQRFGLDPAGRYIGIVATLRSWKGHLYLLEAFAALAHPDWRLLIVGDGPMRTTIEARIAELGITSRVSMVGQRDDSEDWFRAMDIFCLPSYANEGVPQALVQAMLTGLPIVTTPVGAILEAVTQEETALIVPPRDTEAIKAALSRLIEDAELRGNIGLRGRRDAQMRFSHERMVDHMETIFRGVLAQ